MVTRIGHGGSGTDLYRIWSGIKQRCQNPRNPRYKYYGEMGISVCDRWQMFPLFREDVGERPSKDHSLDRIDGFGNYEPGNVRWATRQEQQANLKNNVKLTHEGLTLNLSEWSRRQGLTLGLLRHRMKIGLPVSKILKKENNRGKKTFFTFFGETSHLNDWARRSGVPRKTIVLRVARGLPAEIVLYPGKIKRKNRAKKETK